MRKTILLASAAALTLGFAASSAFADVDVTVNVTKDKQIDTFIHVTITKEVDILVDVNLDATKAAEVDSLVNQAITDNEACENCAEKIDQILDSINGNDGIATLNQAGGNNSNQGNAMSVAVDNTGQNPPQQPTPGSGGFAEAQASTDQRNGITEGLRGAEDGGPVADGNAVDSAEIIFRNGEIFGSINDNDGVTMVNQGTGQMNNQSNNIAIAVALAAGGVALTESDLGQETSNNVTHESDTTKTAEIQGSITGNAGITLVNQAVGNMSNQANVLSLGAAVSIGSL